MIFFSIGITSLLHRWSSVSQGSHASREQGLGGTAD